MCGLAPSLLALFPGGSPLRVWVAGSGPRLTFSPVMSPGKVFLSIPKAPVEAPGPQPLVLAGLA